MNSSKFAKSRVEEAEKLDRISPSKQPFSRVNFILMGVCLCLIIVGFLLMSGGGSSVEGGFNPDIFSTRRIVIGPLFAFLGFLLMAFAIILPPDYFEKKKNKNNRNADGGNFDNSL